MRRLVMEIALQDEEELILRTSKWPFFHLFSGVMECYQLVNKRWVD